MGKNKRTDPKPSILYVGKRGDPELEGLLNELDAVLASAGVRDFSAAEVTKMRKSPGPSFAVPERDFWSRMVRTLVFLQGIRDELGAPISIYNGYRPPDYNEAVGGAESSDHMWNEGVDTKVARAVEDRYLMLLARAYVTRGATLKMAFGVYDTPGKDDPLEAHIGLGWRNRKWGAAGRYINRAKNIA